MLEQEASEIEDELSKAGSYIVIGQKYEDLGDNEKAKTAYQQAVDVLEGYNPSDQTLKDSVAESLQFAEGKVSEL